MGTCSETRSPTRPLARWLAELAEHRERLRPLARKLSADVGRSPLAAVVGHYLHDPSDAAARLAARLGPAAEAEISLSDLAIWYLDDRQAERLCGGGEEA